MDFIIMRIMRFQVYLVPLLTGILFPVSLLITCIVGMSQGHIRVWFSYISDSGVYAPESCIFTFLLGLSALGMACTMWIRYKQIQEFLRESGDEVWAKRLNSAGLLSGLMAGLGVGLAACFQENRVYEMHFFGAFLAFFGGGVYLGMQAFFTFKMAPTFASITIGWFRAFASILTVGLFIPGFVTGLKAKKAYKGEHPHYFQPGLGGWNLHVVSVVTEWTMAAILDIYILSFVPEFKKISREPAKYGLEQVTSQISSNKGIHNGKSKTVVMHRPDQQLQQQQSDSDTAV